MIKKLKLYMIDEKPYLVCLDPIKIGDKVIVTVGGQYPTLVDCSNEQILDLITNPKLTLTRPFKIYLEPDKINLTKQEIQKLEEKDNTLEVVEENGDIKFNL